MPGNPLSKRKIDRMVGPSHRPRIDDRMLHVLRKHIHLKMSPATRDHFLRRSLTTILEHDPTPEQLEAAGTRTLSKVPEHHRGSFLVHYLPSILAHKPTPEIFEKIGNLIEKYGYHPMYLRALLSSRNLGLALERFDSDGRLWLRYPKKGPADLVVLGGKHKGVVLRTLSLRSFQALKKAHEHGIPAEPILERVHKGARILRVSRPSEAGMVTFKTSYTGINLEDFKETPYYERYQSSIENQRKEILRRLDEAGILYGPPEHMHDKNFTVEFVGGRPFVRIIDFKIARLRG